MRPQQSRPSGNDPSDNFRVTVPIRVAVEEFRSLYQAFQNLPMNKKINVQKLLKAKTTEEALQEQSLLDEAEISFISALAKAASESSYILQAPPGQRKGNKIL